MKIRLGKCSGKIYKDSEIGTMQECGISITEKQSVDEEFLSERRAMNKKDCIMCRGCPEYYRE